jgi:hypothetical protein
MTSPHIKAVLFDVRVPSEDFLFCLLTTNTIQSFKIGGVVLKSPFIAIAEYERSNDIPHNYINCSM